jgi:predicted TIM-barrel fold metal-dependent hydrolase
VIEDVVVVNPVVHAFNLRDDNIASRFGAAVRDMMWNMHVSWTPPIAHMPKELFYSDWPVEAMAATVFLESNVDLAANMYLRMDSWFTDGLCSMSKNVEVAKRWPNRFLTYLGVDPTQGVDAILRDFEQQREQLPDAVGVKFYPHQVDPMRAWRMDDADLVFPVYQAALDAGIKTVAVHKAVPNGPVPMAPYHVDDIDEAAMAFPDLNFEIVHSGMAFVEETATAVARFPNVYANLEVTTMLLYRSPRRFAEILAEFLFWGGPEKLIWSDGCMLGHSQPPLQAFWDFQLPADLLDKHQLEPLSKADKALILGQNYARVAGLDLDEVKARIADDEFEKARRTRGLDKPFSNWRRMAGISDG